MNDLRLILLILGVAVIIGLYVRERLRARTDRFDEGPEDEPDQQGFPGMRISPRTGRDDDYSPFLSVLARNRSPKDAATGRVTTRSDNTAEEPDSHTETGGEIISLHVVAGADAHYTGPALLSALEDLGLSYGDMRIFHHYGIGELKAERPLFHLANMLEPGWFDLEDMDSFSTRGLSLFMQLPTPLDAEVVFELMLNTARQLVDMLGGQVMTHDRRPLSEEHIEQIRTRLGNETQ